MAEIVNLNKLRKARRRDERSQEAERNRVIHGRSKAEREAAERLTAKARQALDGARLD